MASGIDRAMQIMRGMTGEMDRLCDDLLLSGRALDMQPARYWRPPTDVYESDEGEIIIKMEISGVRPEDTEVTVQKDVIRVRGCRRDRCPKRKVAFHHMEIHYGYFERSFRIDTLFDPERVGATYRDGFLVVTIPKAPGGFRSGRMAVHLKVRSAEPQA